MSGRTQQLYRVMLNEAVQSSIIEVAEIPEPTCRRYLNMPEEQKIIFSDQKQRFRTYYYYNLLDILR